MVVDVLTDRGIDHRFQHGESDRCPWGLKRNGIVFHTATRASGTTRMLRDYKIDVRTVQVIGNWASLQQTVEYLGIDKEMPELAEAV